MSLRPVRPLLNLSHGSHMACVGQGLNEDQEKKDRIARSQTASTSFGIELPQVPLSDWLIQSEEIVICKRPDGSLYELGTGAFGKVRCLCHLGTITLLVKQAPFQTLSGFCTCIPLFCCWPCHTTYHADPAVLMSRI